MGVNYRHSYQFIRLQEDILQISSKWGAATLGEHAHMQACLQDLVWHRPEPMVVLDPALLAVEHETRGKREETPYDEQVAAERLAAAAMDELDESSERGQEQEQEQEQEEEEPPRLQALTWRQRAFLREVLPVYIKHAELLGDVPHLLERYGLRPDTVFRLRRTEIVY